MKMKYREIWRLSDIATSQQFHQPPIGERVKKGTLPKASGGSTALATPNFGPIRLILDFLLPELWQNKFPLFSVTKWTVLTATGN